MKDGWRQGRMQIMKKVHKRTKYEKVKTEHGLQWRYMYIFKYQIRLSVCF